MAADRKEDIQTVRIPFIGNPTNRSTNADKDQRFVNCYFDVVENPITGKQVYYLVKRPGTSQLSQPSGGAATARGGISWRGDIYTVYGTKIYKNSSDLGVTLTTSTGICGFAATRPGAGTQYLGINDGAKLYLISTAGAVTTVSTIPNPNTRDLIYMDTYFFTLETDGTISNCDSDDPTTWPGEEIVMQMYNGSGVVLAHQNNLLYGFATTSLQAFYDAANSSGSPLTNAEQNAFQAGAASHDSLVFDEGLVTWVGNSDTGGFTVWTLDGNSGLKEIGTSEIRRVLDGEGTSISSCRAMLMRTCGKKLYLLTLMSANRTFVYDYETSLWNEWQAAGATTRWPMIDCFQHNSALIAQHESDGWLYTVSPTVYQDNSVNFTVLARFGRVDFDTDDRKFVNGYELIGDIQSTTTNVDFQYSDDDYQTLSTARIFDMSLVRPFLKRGGNFRRRAHQISYAGANPLRAESLEMKIRL